jgi:hypothetical protein
MTSQILHGPNGPVLVKREDEGDDDVIREIRSTQVWAKVQNGLVVSGIERSHAPFIVADQLELARREIEQLKKTVAQLTWQVDHLVAIAGNV